MKGNNISSNGKVNLNEYYNIIVTGDISMDWNIVCANPPSQRISSWSSQRRAYTHLQHGGALMLAAILERLAEYPGALPSKNIRISKPTIPEGKVTPSDLHYNHSYSLWSKFQSGSNRAWRVKEYLGFDRSSVLSSIYSSSNFTGADTPNMVIINDANLGFRDNPDYWQDILAKIDDSTKIIYKMHRPLGTGPLFDQLMAEHACKTMILITVDDLRQAEAQISQGLSWERTAQDVFWELTYNPKINNLSNCYALILSFNNDGAVLITKKVAESEVPVSKIDARLLFDPLSIEGSWQKTYPGGIIGSTSCLASSLAYQCLISPTSPDLESGIKSGLMAMRELHLHGYDEIVSDSITCLELPFNKVSSAIVNASDTFASVSIANPSSQVYISSNHNESNNDYSGWWTILHDRYKKNLDQVARRIVREGPEAVLKDVPQGKFGQMLRVDRREIEDFRSIQSLLLEYLNQQQHKRPFSIAVFGSPGSGKSFGVTQVAKSLVPGLIEVLEFNLSQFTASTELADAFHRVRDVSLNGKIPLVFWDEFDASLNQERFGWLRYFLSPMQDGSFLEGQIVHPIGRSIFVFAGGTCHNMESFGQDLEPKQRIAAKLPDFISRLKGYINIPCINRRVDKTDQCDLGDPYYIIRRAVLLRSIFEMKTPHLFLKDDKQYLLRIDDGVLRAFLEFDSYKHGVRSMEAIIAMSQISNYNYYARSCLPSAAQLNLHVNGQDFLALVQQVDLEGELLEKMAEVNHNMFCQKLTDQGFQYGNINDETKKTHSSLCPYEMLPEHEKEQNRGVVRDMPKKLALIGYTMVPDRSGEQQVAFRLADNELDYLAELEHERWMQVKWEDGWEYAEQTDKSMKKSKLLVPWSELPNEEKEKDRDIIRAIPIMVAKAGYMVMKQIKSEERYKVI